MFFLVLLSLWAHIWGFTQCISIYDFLQSISFCSRAFCICFLAIVFTIMNTIFIPFNKILITGGIGAAIGKALGREERGGRMQGDMGVEQFSKRIVFRKVGA